MYVCRIILLLNLSSLVWIRVETLNVAGVIPKMVGLSYVLVHECIVVCLAMDGLGCEEVCMVIRFNMLHVQSL